MAVASAHTAAVKVWLEALVERGLDRQRRYRLVID